MPLHFAADIKHPETIALRAKYKNDQKKIAELLRKPGFINKALTQLMETGPYMAEKVLDPRH